MTLRLVLTAVLLMLLNSPVLADPTVSTDPSAGTWAVGGGPYTVTISYAWTDCLPYTQSLVFHVWNGRGFWVAPIPTHCSPGVWVNGPPVWTFTQACLIGPIPEPPPVISGNTYVIDANASDRCGKHYTMPSSYFNIH